MKNQQLDLLFPEDLPFQYELNEMRKEQLSSSLELIFQSLNTDSYQQAMQKIDDALDILDSANTYVPNTNVKNTKKHQESLDYDDFFNVKHIKTDGPEISLLNSVLVTYQRFLLLEQDVKDGQSQNIKIQRQGFRSYFQLLSRVFNLASD